MDTATTTNGRVTPWNKGKLLGQKPPLKLKEIRAIRIRLQLDHRTRELALFNLAIGGRDALGPVFPLFAPCECRGHLQPAYARAERHLRHPDVGPVQGAESLRTSLSSKVSTCQNC